MLSFFSDVVSYPFKAHDAGEDREEEQNGAEWLDQVGFYFFYINEHLLDAPYGAVDSCI